ncbi:MAG: terpene cyclase/mutase family protein [Phycisphaerales bacterium]|nr:terpene cyclase/mutase family protein [Phycisphaerales bacterium]
MKKVALVMIAVGASLAVAQEIDIGAIKQRVWEKNQEQARDDSGVIAGRAAQFLIASQGKDGGWKSDKGPGITALVLLGLVRDPTIGPKHPAVQRGLEFMRRYHREDGGIYGGEGLLKSYETSVALSLYAALKDPALAPLIERAQKFLKDNQWDEGESKSLDDVFYGGAGYGSGKRPDLSNVNIMLDALRDSGLSKDDPTYQKAIAFISRCQMRGESNDQPFAKEATDGGFIYSPANGGESKAGEIEVGGKKQLRTYGSMTYAGYKSLLYCGVSPGDPRVKAARDWIGRHWTLDFNPNMPEKQSREGLYYYYHVLARALAASGDEIVVDPQGNEHLWRAELIKRLQQLQKRDGSFVNEEDRWMEGEPELTTAYALLTVQTTYPRNQ